MPTKEDIAKRVIKAVADAANIKPSLVKPEYVLKDLPLSIDDTGLGFLAVDLRKYIKSINPTETITKAEVRKSDLTVQGLIDNVYNKLK